MAVRYGRQTHEARRRNILNGQRPRGRRASLPQTLFEQKAHALEATAEKLKFYGQRGYMEAVNLCCERGKLPPRPGEKIRVHFLHIIPTYWPSWRSFYQACRDDARFEPTVVLLDCTGTAFEDARRRRSDARGLLDAMGMAYVDFADYDPVRDRPHCIFYNAPYNDYYAYFRKVSPDLVKMAGIRPIYCSYGIEYDAARNSESLNAAHYHHYIQTLAWRSFVMHEDIREGYFRVCRTGGAHASAVGHPKFDAYAATRTEPPPELMEKRNGRKLVVVQIHHLNNHDCRYAYRTHHLPMPELVAILRWLARQEDVFCAVTLHPLFSIWALQKGHMRPEELERLKKDIRQSPNAMLYQGDYQALLPHADAFISGQSSLLLEMAFHNKPILYLYDEPLALKPFAEEIFGSFYHGGGCGRGLADVRTFLARLKNGDDPLEHERRQMWEKNFANHDGRIGLRIKEQILAALALENGSIYQERPCL